MHDIVIQGLKMVILYVSLSTVTVACPAASTMKAVKISRQLGTMYVMPNAHRVVFAILAVKCKSFLGKLAFICLHFVSQPSCKRGLLNIIFQLSESANSRRAIIISETKQLFLTNGIIVDIHPTSKCCCNYALAGGFISLT